MEKLALMSIKDARDALTAKGVKNLEGANIRYHEYFDRQPYLQAGQLILPFFSRNPALVSEDDCNLRSGKSEMPNSQAFIVLGMSVSFEPGADQTLVGAAAATSLAAIDDYLIVARSGRVTFKVGSREDYVENGPISRFPPLTHPMFGGALSDSSTAGASQRTSMQNVYIEGPMYPLTPKVLLPGDFIDFNTRWSALKPVSVAGVIEGRLYGILADIR